MANNKYITDPITGEKISNDPTDKKNNPKIEDTFNLDPITFEPIGNKYNPLDKNGEFLDRDISQEEASTLPFNSPFLTKGELFDIRARHQSAGEQVLNGLGKAGVTFGTALAENTIGLAAGIGSVATGGSFFDHGFGNMLDSINKWSQEAMPNYYTQKQQREIDMLSTNFWFDKVANGLAYSAASATSMLIPSTGLVKTPFMVARAINKLGKGTALGKSMDEIASAVKPSLLGKLENAAQKGIKAGQSALAESGIEARETSDQYFDMAVEKKLADKRKAIINANPNISEEELESINLSQEEFDEIQKNREAAANVNFGLNFLMTGTSNILMFGKLMRPSYKQSMKRYKELIGKNADGKFDLKSNLLTKGQKRWNAVKNRFEDAATEAAQEGGQYASNQYALDYFMKSYEDRGFTSMMESAGKALEQTYGSHEGRESMLIGAIVGGGMSLGKSIKTRKTKRENESKLQEVLDIYNSGVFDNLQTDLKNNQRTYNYIVEAQEALKNNDQPRFHRAMWQALVSDVDAHISKGGIEIYLEKLEELKEMDPQEFAKYFDYSEKVDMTKEERDNLVNNIKKNVQDLADIKEGIETRYNDSRETILDKILKDKPGSEAAIAKQMYKSDLYNIAASFNYINNRENELGKEIEELSEGVITYDFNKRGASEEYMSQTSEQKEQFTEKQFIKSFTKLINESPSLKGKIKKAMKEGGHSRISELLSELYGGTTELSTKMKWLSTRLDNLRKEATLNPVKVQEIESKFSELAQLAFERELANELYNQLENIETPKNKNAFQSIVDQRIKAIQNEAKKRVENQVAEATTQEDLDKAKATAKATGNEEDENTVDDAIAKQAEKEFKNSNNLDLKTDLANQLKERYTNNPSLAQEEIKDINEAIKGFKNAPQFDPNKLDDFYRFIDTVNRKSKTFNAILEYYASRNDKKDSIENENDAGDPIDYIPVEITENDLKNSKSAETEKDGSDTKSNTLITVKREVNVEDIERRRQEELNAVRPTDDMTARGIINDKYNAEIAALRQIDEFVLNNPEFATKGTKVSIEVQEGNPYNKKFKEGTQEWFDNVAIHVFVEDEVHGKQSLGLVRAASSNDPLAIQVRKALKEGTLDQLELYVDEKYAGRIKNGEELLTPLQTSDNPIYGIARKNKQGETTFDIPNFEDAAQVRYNTNKLTPGAIYLIIPTANGKTYYPVLTATRVLKEFPELKQKAIDIISDVTKENLDESKKKLNEIVYLNWGIDKFSEGNIFIKFSDEKRPTQKIPIEQSKEILSTLLDNMVVKVDASKINKGDYNKQVADRLVTNLDPALPIQGTSFKIGIKTESNLDSPSKVSTPTNLSEKPKIQEAEDLKEPVQLDIKSSGVLDSAWGKSKKLNRKKPTSKSDNQSKKADIERRRKEELSNKFNKKQLGFFKDGWSYAVAARQDYFNFDEEYAQQKYNEFKEINAKYDAELAALENESSTEPLDISDFPFESGDNIGKTRRVVNYEKADIESEMEYLERVLPNTPRVIRKDLVRLANMGEDVHGLFMNGIIYLRDNFAKGTAFHEAFHAVFNTYLTYDQRAALYAEAQSLYGTHSDEEYNSLKEQYPNLSNNKLEDIWLEEQMAEAFREYVQKEIKDKSLTERIKGFFKRIWSFIKNFIKNGYRPVTMDKIFRNIHKGKFAKQNPVARSSYEPMTRRFTKFSASETRDIIDMVDTLFMKLVDHYANQKNVSPETILQNNKIYNVFYAEIYNSFAQKFREYESPEDKQFILDITNELLDVSDPSNPKVGGLAKMHMQLINLRYGIKAYSNIEDDINIEAHEEEEIFGENYSQSNIEKSGKETLSFDIKKLFHNIPSRTETNIFGEPRSMNSDSLYNYVERNLSDIFNESDQMDKLKELVISIPELQSIVDKLEEGDEILRAGFYSTFAKGQNIYESVVETEEGVIKVINDSRKTVRADILSDWEANIKSTDMYKTVEGRSLPVKDKFKPLLSDYNDALDKLKSKDGYSINDFVPFEKIFKKIKIDISARDIYNQYLKFEEDKRDGRIKELLGNNDWGLKGSLIALSNGTDIFTTFTKDINNSLKNFANVIASNRPDYFQSSLMSSENKMKYSFVLPALIHNQLQILNSYNPKSNTAPLDFYFNGDPAYKKLSILRKIRDDINHKLNVTTVNGLRFFDESSGTDYKKFNRDQFKITKLNMFLNNGNKKTSKYFMPVMSDSPIAYTIEHDRLDKEDALEQIYRLFEFERDRKSASELKNWTGDQSFFGFIKDPSADKDTIKGEIESYLEEEYKRYEKDLNDTGIITVKNNEDGSQSITSNVIGQQYKDVSDINNLEKLLKSFVYNSFIVNIETSSIFGGDVNSYKDVVDFNKRFKQLTAPSQRVDIRITGETANLGVVSDVTKSMMDSELLSVLKDKHPEIYKLWKENTPKDEPSQTDGQSYITLDRFYKVHKGAGNRKIVELIDDYRTELENGTEPEFVKDLILNSIKGYYASLNHTLENGKPYLIQKKDSEMPLLRSFTKDNPKLDKILDRMESKGDFKDMEPIDILSYDTTIKVGLHKNIGSIEDLENIPLIKINNRDYGIQQPSPEKHIDTQNIFGTQFRKHILSYLQGDYSIKRTGESLSADEIFDTYQSIIDTNVNESFNDFIREMGFEDNDIKKLQKLLLRELDNGRYGYEFTEALEIKNGEFTLPLWMPFHSHRIEAMLNSVAKKKITRQKIKGATLINASDYGVTLDPKADKDLQIRVNEDGSGYTVEAILPAWSKAIFNKYMDKDGNLSEDMPDSLRELVGYRIPTEAKYSMFKIKVMKFSPSNSGQIYLPAAMTKQTGFDFDIDKVYIMIPEHKNYYDYTAIANSLMNNNSFPHSVTPSQVRRLLNENVTDEESIIIKNDIKNNIDLEDFVKDIEYISYDYSKTPGEQSLQQRNNGLIEMSKAILEAPQTLNEITRPGSFQNLIDAAKGIRTLKGQNNRNLNVGLSSTQDFLFENNSVAGELIGVFANQAANHVMLQRNPMKVGTNIRLKVNNETVVYDTLDNVYKSDKIDKSIGTSLGTLVAAAVDAVKDPVFYTLGISRNTADIFATMIRLGFPEKTAIYILQQPAVKEIAAELDKDKFAGSSSFKAIMQNMIEKYGKENNSPISEQELESEIKELGKMENNGKIDPSQFKHQDKVLHLFRQLYDVSKELSDIIQITRRDSTAAGPTMAENEVKIRKYNKVIEGETTTDQTKRRRIKGMVELFENNPKLYPSIITFYKKGIEEVNDVFGNYFPYLNTGFKSVKNKIENHLGSDLTAKSINDINQDLMSYIFSQTEFFNLSNERKGYLLNKFFKDFMKFKDNHKGEYLILDMLTAHEGRIVFRNTTKIESDKLSDIKDSWEQLFEEYPGTAKLLAQYNYLINGVKYNNMSFNHLLPLYFYTDVIGEELNQIKDTIKNSETGDIFDPFVEQYLRNNYFKVNLPRMSSDNNDFKVEIGSKNLPIVIDLKSSSPAAKRFMNDRGNIETIYPDYIITDDRSRLYKKLPSTSKYMIMPTLGDKYVTEYFYDNPAPVSIVKSNWVTLPSGKKFGSGNIEAQFDKLNQESKESVTAERPKELPKLGQEDIQEASEQTENNSKFVSPSITIEEQTFKMNNENITLRTDGQLYHEDGNPITSDEFKNIINNNPEVVELYKKICK